MAEGDWARPLGGKKWEVISGAFEHEGNLYPSNYIELSPPALLQKLGFRRVAPADSPPEGHNHLGYEVVDHDGGPKCVVKTEPVPVDIAQRQALSAIAGKRADVLREFTYDGVSVDPERIMPEIAARLTLRRELQIAADVKLVFPLAEGEYREWDLAADLEFAQALFSCVQERYDAEAAAAAKVKKAKSAAAALKVVDGA